MSQTKSSTDNQILQNLFEKYKLRKRAARQMETFETFGVFEITMNPRKIHVVKDVLGLILEEEAVVNTDDNAVEVPYVDFPTFINGYDDYQIFQIILQALKAS